MEKEIDGDPGIGRRAEGIVVLVTMTICLGTAATNCLTHC